MEPTEDGALSCAEVDELERAEDYLLGRLADVDRDAFESHYFACERCALRLEALRSIRSALAAPQAGSPLRTGTPTRARRPWGWIGLAAGLAAAGFATWRLVPPRPLPPGPPSTTVATPTAGPSLADLGRFEAPPYDPSLLRGESESAFRDAMRRYRAGDCPGALPGLEAAVRQEPKAPEPLFFLGVCRLLTGRLAEGNESLRRSIAAGDSPYLEWAHFHLAKGLLLSGDASAALVELERTIALEGDLEGEARELMQRVTAAGH